MEKCNNKDSFDVTEGMVKFEKIDAQNIDKQENTGDNRENKSSKSYKNIIKNIDILEEFLDNFCVYMLWVGWGGEMRLLRPKANN